MTSFKYHGFSSFSIWHEGTHILLDPWIDDPPWTKVSATDFSDVDLILVTHGAYDHLGDTIHIARESKATVITEPAVADHLLSMGLPNKQVNRMIWGNHLRWNDITVRCLETRHISYFESGDITRIGLPLGFILDFGPVSLYYLGDTSIFSDLELFADLFEPDIAVIPIGSAPGSFAPLPPREAAIVAEWLGVKVIPVHYVPGSNELDEFVQSLGDTCENPPDIFPLKPGERTNLSS